jgi:RNA polymerase subunit RPABC4/transcription elongation factor Spt4
VLDNTWCGEHGQGYAYTQLITSRVLFDAVDAHGHDFDRDVMQCVACKRMMDTGGFCEDCRFGWVDGQAYMSRLTYHLALGEARDVTSLACASCRDLVGTVGSCEGCSGAWVGNVFFVDPNDHEAAVHEFERLQVATEVSARCETCAMLVLVDGKCPYCKVEYFDGTRLRAPQ